MARPELKKRNEPDFDARDHDRTRLFPSADLRAASFRGGPSSKTARLGGARLADADFRSAALRGTTAEGIDLSKAVTPALSQPSAEVLDRRLAEHARWVESGGAEGVRGDFSGLDLSGRDFSGALLAAVRFAGAVLAGCRFRGALLSAAEMTGANLVDADFTGADLRAADLAGANLRGATLQDAVIGELPGTGLETRMD